MSQKNTCRVGDVNVYARGDYYHASYWTPAGRQRRALKTTNQRAAVRRARTIDDLLSREAWEELAVLDEEKKKPMTLQAFVYHHFLPKYCDWAASTRKGNAGRLRLLCVEWGHYPLLALTARDIKTYLKRREVKGLSLASQNRYLAALKALFKAAVAYGHCSVNPAADIAMRREEQRIPEALTAGQIETLLGACSDRIRPIVTVAVDTGLRRSELFGLTWADVDLAEGKLTVRKSKTGDFRVVWLPDRSRQVLAERKVQRAGRKTVDLRVFPFTDIRQGLDAAGKQAGIGHVHMHQLRHTYATRLRDQGVPLDRIKELLGHKTMQMVLRYAKARPEQTREAVAALNA